MLVPREAGSWGGIASGAFLAFYAYIGFEDMVNMAEEVRDPGRVLPRAVPLALGLTTLIYFVAATTAALALPPDALAASEAPFANIVAAHSDFPTSIISLVSLFAVGNGALVQVIMASRVVYGMARRGGAPTLFRAVHPGTQTPVRATLFAGALVLVFALALPLEALARVTSSIILVVFATVNGALLWLKATEDRPEGRDARERGVRFPALVPALGLLSCLGFLAVQIVELVE
jgi:amino acid transporter